VAGNARRINAAERSLHSLQLMCLGSILQFEGEPFAAAAIQHIDEVNASVGISFRCKL
jgi:hypothetical protein